MSPFRRPRSNSRLGFGQQRPEPLGPPVAQVTPDLGIAPAQIGPERRELLLLQPLRPTILVFQDRGGEAQAQFGRQPQNLMMTVVQVWVQIIVWTTSDDQPQVLGQCRWEDDVVNRLGPRVATG